VGPPFGAGVWAAGCCWPRRWSWSRARSPRGWWPPPVGSPLFHEHLARVHVGEAAAETVHTEEAYQSANAISLSLALLAALAVAMAVNVVVTHRIGRSVATIADAASSMAHGRYDVRVPRGWAPSSTRSPRGSTRWPTG
jgi:hypothetical protein